jgi:hypothetical protein
VKPSKVLTLLKGSKMLPNLPKIDAALSKGEYGYSCFSRIFRKSQYCC